MKRYIGYYRVSTDKQGLDGNGMTSQREIVRRFVDGQTGTLERKFSEVEPAVKRTRKDRNWPQRWATRSGTRAIIAKLVPSRRHPHPEVKLAPIVHVPILIPSRLASSLAPPKCTAANAV